MRIRELQNIIIEKLGLNLTDRMVQRRTDEFLPDVVRAENNDAREYTKEQTDKMVVILALKAIGVPDEGIKGVLNGSLAINSVNSNYLSMMKICNFVDSLFDKEEVVNE